MRQYLHLLNDVMALGEPHEDRTGVGTLSVFGYQFRHRMSEGFPLLTTKKLPFRWIKEELKWFLSGSTNEKDLRATGVDIWKEWATEEQCERFKRPEGELGLVYGGLWRHFPIGISDRDFSEDEGFKKLHSPPKFIDQIEWLIGEMTKNPNSRRLIVSGWHPYYQQRVELPPCHTLWQIKLHERDTSASLHLYARSIDTFLGLPFNIASYGLLLSLICELTGRKPRDLIISFGDLHIYKNHIRQVEEQLARTPRQLPKLKITAKSITDWDASVVGYDPYPKIEADVAV